MGTTPAPPPAETLVQLVLRARHLDELVQNEQDWRALGTIAAHMLFWCGGTIYACRSEADEMRFALQLVHAPLGTVAHQIAGAYATHLRKTRNLSGSIFKHYAVVPLREAVFLDELVLWLHRSALSDAPGIAKTRSLTRVWTAESAYLQPHALPWINTDRVLTSLSVGAPGAATYRRRKSEPIPSSVLEYFTRRPKHLLPEHRDRALREPRPSIETIARAVADYSKVSYEDMLAGTRKRSVSRARVITTVLATRNGATAAAAARLFNRSRSTLIEQVEHYRTKQAGIFVEAESSLEVFLAKARE
jgi:hypothetical protein